MAAAIATLPLQPPRQSKERVKSTPISRPAVSKAASSSAGYRQTSRSRQVNGSSALDDRPGSGDSTRSAGKLILGVGGKPGSRPSSRAEESSGTTARTNRTALSKEARASSTSAAQRRRAASPAPAAEPETTITVDRQSEEINRQQIVEGLANTPNFSPADDNRAFHGRAFALASADASVPKVTWKSDQKPRKNSPEWLTATEYADTPQVFNEKIQLLARLLKASRRTLAYTGAGLSVAAGIGQAAVGSSNIGGMGVAAAGEPTLTHCVMAELNRQNLMHGWVQQNHDGLPQKAGYRQEDINEIHGSWFDPANPVVKYSGSLRGDLFEDMENQADNADLVVVMGTSLTGLNADQCVTKTAQRSREGRSLGSIIISPQRTGQDGKASLRIFAKSDDVMKALAREFNLGPRALGKGAGIKKSADLFPKVDKVLVPYDKNGYLSTTVRTWWDLSRGNKVRIGPNNNVDGAKQPQDEGLATSTVGTITGRDENKCCISFTINGCNKRIGLWWLETAQRGGVAALPIVNVNAKEIAA